MRIRINVFREKCQSLIFQREIKGIYLKLKMFIE